MFRREIDRALALGGWDGIAKLDPSVIFRQGATGDRKLELPRNRPAQG